MSTPAPTNPNWNIVERNPGITATILTIVVAAIFLGALYRVATSHGG